VPVRTQQKKVPSAEQIPQLTEHLFRHESGRLVSILTGIFGIERLQLAEDVVQEALVRALQTWPYYGVPDNPAGWIMQTAKHLALDVLRREKRFADKQPEMAGYLEQWTADNGTGESPRLTEEIKDNQLRLMFACCHNDIPQEAQTALALRTLCGLNVAEIATAFLSTEAAIAKRLTRARARIQENQIPFEIPAGEELTARLDGVLKILYLLFNEGYKASSGECLIRENLCYEAIRLGVLLSEHPATNRPRVHALVALMMLHGARLSARCDAGGNILTLKDQDRSLWDARLIQNGVKHLGLAAQGKRISTYHLQAGIAAQHCIAADYESTNWQVILGLYDKWLELEYSPVVALNRAVALANTEGPKAGKEAVAAIVDRSQLDSYYLTYAILGEFEAQLKNYSQAASYLQRALELMTGSTSEKAFLKSRLNQRQTQAKK